MDRLQREGNGRREGGKREGERDVGRGGGNTHENSLILTHKHTPIHTHTH
jgi:hypothetical protein